MTVTGRITLFLWVLLTAWGAHTQEWDAVEAGAVRDGKTDNTAVFQRLLDKAGEMGGGTVKVPSGRYRVKGTLSIPGSVILEGTFRVPPTNRRGAALDHNGSVLLAYAGRGTQEGEPFIRLDGNMATISGLIVEYPEWRQSDVPPVPYPPCVLCEGHDNVGILNCCFVNPYEAVRFVNVARYIVRNLYGHPSWRGLYIDACYDIGRVENCHFWPFSVVYLQDDPYCKWINTYGVAFEFARTDWQYVLNTFCFGYGVGYKFSQSKHGACNGNFLGIGADSCRRGVLVEQAQSAGLLITNGEFVGRWGSADSVCVEIGKEARGKVSLANCSFWGPNDRCVWHRSPEAQFTATGCHFGEYDVNGMGVPAVQIDASKAILQGNTFGEGVLHAQIGKDVQSAILIGNQATTGFHAENNAGERTQLLSNEKDPVVWTDEARAHYRINIGSPGDGRYLRRWHPRESGGGRVGHKATCRWSTTSSMLHLPVLPHTEYTVIVDVRPSQHAASEEAGIYLGRERLAGLPVNRDTLVVRIPPLDTDYAVIELRCEDWRPADQTEGSVDSRTLGVMFYAVTVRAENAGDRIFNANTGRWIE